MQPDTEQANKAPKRDWLGYAVTTAAGVIATIAVAWYQLNVSQRDAAAAELEKVRAVRQVAVAIVEEHVLNGKKLELDRLARLIDQRRRDEAISLSIPVEEVVELAEFSISSSRHLAVDRKEEMKPLFDAFYAELRARSFQPNEGSTEISTLLNRTAKSIQEGRPAEALDTLKKLGVVHQAEVALAAKGRKPGLFDVIADLFSSPTKIALNGAFLVGYFWLFFRFKRWLDRRRFRSDSFRPL